MFISVSGPCMTGKSTIISLLKDQLPEDTVYISDVFRDAWNEFQCSGFEYFSEVAKDRDFTIMYISKIVKKYLDIVNNLDPNKLYVAENCFIDYLIYAQISSWYHYPLAGFLEDTITKLLESSDKVDKVYITTPDDINYPMTKATILDCKTIKAYFKRNRGLENKFYDVYRKFNNCVTLPPVAMECDAIILDDLKKEFNI